MVNSIGIGIGMGIGGAAGGPVVEGDPPEIAVNAVKFDGSNDYLIRGDGLTGAADNKFALISFWFNLNGDDDSNVAFLRASGGLVMVRRDAANTISILLFDSSVVGLWQGATTATFVAAGGWTHFLLAADMTTDSTPRSIYINDVLETMTGETKNAGNIDWTRTDWAVGAEPEAGARKITADVAEFYVTDEFLDLSEESNRRKFRSSGGKPVDLGSDGSAPTGTAPLIYLSGATSTWHTNDGTGEGFTETGELTDGTSSPSD